MEISVYLMFDDQTKQEFSQISSLQTLKSDLKICDIKKLFNDQPDEIIHCLYNSKLLEDSSSLSEVGIKDKSCLKLIKRKDIKGNSQTDKEYDEMIADILKIHEELLRTQRRETLNRMILECVGDMVELNASIRAENVAFSIATEPRLLRILFSNKENVEKVLGKHPVLIPAALKTLQKIQERLRTSRRVPTDMDRYFSLAGVEQSDSSSDDEDASTSAASTSAALSVSRDQLRQAIQASGVPGARTRSRTERRVSRAQFRHAIRAANSGPAAIPAEQMDVDDISPEPVISLQAAQSESSSPHVPTQSAVQLDAAVSQIVTMGLGDEAGARGALEASGGDINAAIEFLLG